MAAVYTEFIGIIRRRGEVVFSRLNDNLCRTFLHTDAVAPALFLINVEKAHIIFLSAPKNTTSGKLNI
jgi:hypothetical protein